MRCLLILVVLANTLATVAAQQPGRDRQGDRAPDKSRAEADVKQLTDLSPSQRATIMGIVEDLRRRFPDRPITPQGIGRQLHAIDAELFALLDRNHSGTLEHHELPRRLWHRPQRRSPAGDLPADEQWRERLQTLRRLHPGLIKRVRDADGQINPAALRVAWQRYQEVLQRFDADGDGHLSDDELRHARPVIAAWLRHATDEDPGPTDDDAPLRSDLQQDLIERYDRDGDGRLDAAERTAARAELTARLQQRLETLRRDHPDLFAEIDADGDGVISPEELRQWRQQRRQGRRDRTDRHEQREPGRRQGRGSGSGQGRGRQQAEP